MIFILTAVYFNFIDEIYNTPKSITSKFLHHILQQMVLDLPLDSHLTRIKNKT